MSSDGGSVDADTPRETSSHLNDDETSVTVDAYALPQRQRQLLASVKQHSDDDDADGDDDESDDRANH